MHIGLNVSTCYSYQVLTEREFARQILVTSSNITFMKIRRLGAELFCEDGRTDRQTDRHDEANSHFS